MKLCLGAEKNQYHLWPRKMHIAVQLAKCNKFDLFFGNSANSEVKFASILLFYIIRKWSSCRHCFCNDVLYWNREFCEISRNFEILLKKSPIQQQYSVYTILNHKINLNEEHSADFWDYQNWQDFKSSSFKEFHGSKWCKYVV